jgi:hypothetical protein
VSTGPDDAFDLDLAAATLISEGKDIEMLLRVLVKQLSDSLGPNLVVEREGGRFHKSDKIKSLDVQLGSDRFRAETDKAALSCTVERTSGGVRIRSERLEMDEWLRRLLDKLKTEATHSQAARQALEKIVIGEP